MPEEKRKEVDRERGREREREKERERERGREREKERERGRECDFVSFFGLVWFGFVCHLSYLSLCWSMIFYSWQKCIQSSCSSCCC